MKHALLSLLLLAPAATAQMPAPKVTDVDGFFDKLAKAAAASKVVDVAPRNGRTLTVEHPSAGLLRLVTHGDLDKGARPVLGVEELRSAGPAKNGQFELKLTRLGAGGKQTATADCTGDYWLTGERRQSATIVCHSAGEGEHDPAALHLVLRLNPGSTTIAMRLPKSKQSYIFIDPSLFERQG